MTSNSAESRNRAEGVEEANNESKATEHYSLRNYMNELKENINFIVGLGGLMFVIITFHYAILKIRSNEYYGVNTDLLNEGILIEGVRNFIITIFFIIGMVGLFSALIYLPRHYLKENNVKVRDKSSNYITTGMIIAAVCLGGLSYTYKIWKSYDDEVPDTVLAFLILTAFLFIHLFISIINLQITLSHDKNTSAWDVSAMFHLIYVGLMFVTVVLPFFHINNQLLKSDSITMTVDKEYMLVEKDKNTLLLRKVKKEKNQKNINAYELSDEYIFKDAKKEKLMEFNINNTTSYEKSKKIMLEE